jgi:hypothetical protein
LQPVQRGHACHIGLLHQTGLDELDRLGLLRRGRKPRLLKSCATPYVFFLICFRWIWTLVGFSLADVLSDAA